MPGLRYIPKRTRVDEAKLQTLSTWIDCLPSVGSEAVFGYRKNNAVHLMKPPAVLYRFGGFLVTTFS